MLEMRPNCECCDKDLPADVAGAYMCSFECTFCDACATSTLKGRCPNCGGGLVADPCVRAPCWPGSRQASTERSRPTVVSRASQPARHPR